MGTPWHTIKPRARQLHINTWIVYGADIAAYATTLHDALVLWRECMLASQVGA